MRHGGEVDDRRVRQLRIGNHHRGLVEPAHHGRAEPDIFDMPFDHAVDVDPIALVKSLFGQDQQSRDQVLEQVLRAQGDGHTDQAEPGDDRADLDPPDFQDRRRGDDKHQHANGAGQPVDHLFRENAVQLVQKNAQWLDRPEQAPENGEGDQGAD